MSRKSNARHFLENEYPECFYEQTNLPKGTRMGVVDLLPTIHAFAYSGGGARTGLDFLKFVTRPLTRILSHPSADFVVACVDHGEFVPPTKGPEQRKRKRVKDFVWDDKKPLVPLRDPLPDIAAAMSHREYRNRIIQELLEHLVRIYRPPMRSDGATRTLILDAYCEVQLEEDDDFHDPIVIHSEGPVKRQKNFMGSPQIGEADMLCVHYAYVARHTIGADGTVTLVSKDTDVLLLALLHFPRLGIERLHVEYDIAYNTKTQRYVHKSVDIKQLHETLLHNRVLPSNIVVAAVAAGNDFVTNAFPFLTHHTMMQAAKMFSTVIHPIITFPPVKLCPVQDPWTYRHPPKETAEFLMHRMIRLLIAAYTLKWGKLDSENPKEPQNWDETCAMVMDATANKKNHPPTDDSLAQRVGRIMWCMKYFCMGVFGRKYVPEWHDSCGGFVLRDDRLPPTTDNVWTPEELENELK